MNFRKAGASDLDAVCCLYRMASKGPFSVWNEEYPARYEAEHDLETENLFVLTEGGAVIGAISIVPESEMEDLQVWQYPDLHHREIARIAISPAWQGRRLAAYMVEQIFGVLRERGYQSVRLSAASCNIPACKTYAKLGFIRCGEADMYGSHYYLMEKKL